MGSRKVYVVTSWDDTTQRDLKICEFLEKYDFKGTFFVVSNWIGKKISKDELRYISDRHEIGAHTLDHVALTKTTEDLARAQIFRSKMLLEEELNKPVSSFAYPFGDYNAKVAKMVKNAQYLCARTTTPFRISHPDNLYEIDVASWTYPYPVRDLKGIFRLSHLFGNSFFNPMRMKEWSAIGREIFDVTLRVGGVFHIFGHSWQIDELNGWQKLEDLFAHLAFRKNVNYVTFSEYVTDLISEMNSVSKNF